MFKFLVFLFLCLLIVQPDKAIQGTKEGILLWYNAVLPTQLPFAIGVRLLWQYISFHKFSPIIFNFLAGMMAGCPMGSVVTIQLYKKGYVPKENVTALSALSNMTGPLFVIGTIGVILFDNIHCGYILLVVHWITAISLSIPVLLRTKKATRRNMVYSLDKQAVSVNQDFTSESDKCGTIGVRLGDAISETAQLMLKIAGFIVLFSVLKQWVGGAWGAVLEMSGGVQWMIDQKVRLKWKLVGCSFLVNFSGICIILQSLAGSEGAPISTLRFLGWKLLQGILGAVFMLGICQILLLAR